MLLIIGGAYQGKAQFAKELLPNQRWIDGRECAMDEIFSCDAILNFHAYIRRAMLEKRDISRLSEHLLKHVAVVVTDEVGCGIVPADAFEREYREKTGRICTELALKSEKVYRVVCGIGTVIKG